MIPIPIATQLVADRMERYREAAGRRTLARGRVRRPARRTGEPR